MPSLARVWSAPPSCRGPYSARRSPRVAQTKSADLLLLASLLLALGTAFAAHRAGLAAPIGAFLAGLVVGESDFRHQVEDDVRPFRDVLLGLFFVTVGMEIDPSIVAVAPWAVIVWVVAFLPGKVLATLVVAAIMRWPAQAGIRVAVVLAHGGEFGLLLLTQAMAGGIIEPRLGQPVLVGLVLTMAVAPVVVQRNASIRRTSATPSGRLRQSEEGMRCPKRASVCTTTWSSADAGGWAG